MSVASNRSVCIRSLAALAAFALVAVPPPAQAQVQQAEVEQTEVEQAQVQQTQVEQAQVQQTEVQEQNEILISNSTGPSDFPQDDNDSRITMRIGCDGAERNLAAGGRIGCRGVRTVSITPVGEVAGRVRLRVVSGEYRRSAEGVPFTAGTVTFDTSPTNPDCDPDYNARSPDEVTIGWHVDDGDLTDNQVLEGGLEYVTVRHRCRPRAT